MKLFSFTAATVLVAFLSFSTVFGQEDASSCSDSLQRFLGVTPADVETSALKVHQNAQGEACTPLINMDWSNMVQAFSEFDCPTEYFDKYQVESYLTRLLSDVPCGDKVLLDYCDMGPQRTPIQVDHENLIPLEPEGSLPCRFYTREGIRISSLADFAELLLYVKHKSPTCAPGEENNCVADEDDGLHLYAVPAGRVFMFPASFVGEVIDLPHIENNVEDEAPVDGPVSLRVLSLEPRVFEIFHFFSPTEARQLVDKALHEESATHKLKRSTTGTDSVYQRRTSENAWDTHGLVANRIKRRCMTTLGFDEYMESYTDGLQILRYNTTAAYIPHMDYMTDPGRGSMYDYDTSKTGGNRFATILLYMSDLQEGDGGETVFSKAYDPNEAPEDHRSLEQALEDLRASKNAEGVLEEGSWQEEMTAVCQSRLKVRPKMARSVLFYSQLPDGRADPMSKHGGCPMIHGEKWAANLWVWNLPRGEFPGAPMKEKFRKEGKTWDSAQPQQLKATFRNSGDDTSFEDAELFYEDTFWAHLGHGEGPHSVNTFEGHKWNVKVNGETKKQFVIQKGPFHQVFTV